MKLLTIVIFLLISVVHAFEPGERMALQMKPGLIAPIKSYGLDITISGLETSLQRALSIDFDINDTEYQAIFGDVDKSLLYKGKKYYMFLASKLEDNEDYQSLMNMYKERCTNDYLTNSQLILSKQNKNTTREEHALEYCQKIQQDIFNKRSEIFDLIPGFKDEGVDKNKDFEKVKLELLDVIRNSIQNYKEKHADTLSNSDKLLDFLRQYIFTQKLKYLTGFNINEYNRLFSEKVEENTNNKLASSISPTLVEGLGNKLHVNIYRGRLSNSRIPITLKAAAANYDTLNQDSKMEDTLMDYSGGLLNLRVDLVNYFFPNFDPKTDYRNFDSYGFSIQVGGKFDNYPITGENNESNVTESHLTPYASLVTQIDWNLYSNDDLTSKEGYLLTGLTISYQLVDKDFRRVLGLENHNLYTWEFYGKIYINEKFGLRVSYSQALLQARDVLDSRTYLSFDIEP